MRWKCLHCWIYQIFISRYYLLTAIWASFAGFATWLLRLCYELCWKLAHPTLSSHPAFRVLLTTFLCFGLLLRKCLAFDWIIPSDFELHQLQILLGNWQLMMSDLLLDLGKFWDVLWFSWLECFFYRRGIAGAIPSSWARRWFFLQYFY